MLWHVEPVFPSGPLHWLTMKPYDFAALFRDFLLLREFSGMVVRRASVTPVAFSSSRYLFTAAMCGAAESAKINCQIWLSRAQ